jgi:hypothetical protein
MVGSFERLRGMQKLIEIKTVAGAACSCVEPRATQLALHGTFLLIEKEVAERDGYPSHLVAEFGRVAYETART